MKPEMSFLINKQTSPSDSDQLSPNPAPDRFRLFAIAGVVAILLLAGAASAAFSHFYHPPAVVDKHLDSIRQRGVLIVGTDASYPPFAYVDGGQYKGFDVEMARRLAERLGVKVEFVNISYDGLYDALKTDRVDIVVSAMSPIPELMKDFAYSAPYLDAGQVLVVRSGETEIRTVSDLAGRTTGVELGSLADTEARQLATTINGMKLQSVYQLPGDALQALSMGRIDAVITDRVSAMAFTRLHQDVKILSTPVTSEPYVVVMKADAPKLLGEVNSAISAFGAEGVLAQLEKEYF